MNDKPKRLRAIIYARYSPRPNAAECESSKAQIKELKKLCRLRGYLVSKKRIFKDNGISGGTVDRAGLRAAMRKAKRGTVFVCRDCKRLGRGLGTFGIVETLLNRGVKIESIADGEFSDTDTAKFVVWCVKIVMGSVERIDNARRTSLRMRDHQADGRRMSGRIPYGWKIDENSPLSQREQKPKADGTVSEPMPTRMVRDEAEQAILQRVVHEHTVLGLSLHRIAQRLNAEAEQDPAKACRGGLYYKMSIKRWIERELKQKAAV